MPLMVQKSDGGFGYGTTDMAALRQRVHDERGDWIIYVVDEGQSGHFKYDLRAPPRPLGSCLSFADHCLQLLQQCPPRPGACPVLAAGQAPCLSCSVMLTNALGGCPQGPVQVQIANVSLPHQPFLMFECAS